MTLTKYHVESFSLTQGQGRIEGEFKMEAPKDVLFQQEIIPKLILTVNDTEWVMGNVFISPRFFLEDFKEVVECSFSCRSFYVNKLETTAIPDKAVETTA